MMKVMVFAPFSAIWPHVFPEALVCEALQQYGHEIIYITCGRALDSLCLVQQSRSLKKHTITEKARRELCLECSRNKKIIKNEFQFHNFDISDYITDAHKKMADELALTVTPQNVLDFSYESVQVGRQALYVSLLQFKKSNMKFTDEEWDHCKEAIRNTLLVTMAAKLIIEKYQPDIFITYNNLYESNAAFSAVAKQYNAKIYSLHRACNLAHTSGLSFTEESNTAFGRYLMKFWEKVKDIPCPQEYLSKITDHFLEVTKGLSVFAYSAPKKLGEQQSIRDVFRIPSSAKIICATMSSYDERFAAETTGNMPKLEGVLFPNAIAWINSLFDFTRTHPNVFLIVRVHPREFPNKREGEKSSHAEELERAFQNLPQNAVINWPSQNISLYDLADDVDVFLNAWSSTGKEMSLLGLPVVNYSRAIMFYPPELNEWAETHDDYYAAIEKCLNEGANFERIRMMYRWMAIELNRSSISFAESIKTLDNGLYRYPLPIRAYRKFMRTISPGYYERKALRARAKNPKFYEEINYVVSNKLPNSVEAHNFTNPENYTLAEETLAIQGEIKRIINALYPNNSVARKGSLHEKLLQILV